MVKIAVVGAGAMGSVYAGLLGDSGNEIWAVDSWVEHVEAAGYPVRVVESADLDSMKQRLGVPAELASCHTAEVGGYVVEGHVPAAAINRLLAERPSGTGLTVPGMPVGSPGMEIPGVDPEPYEVLLFGSTIRTFGRFLGSQEL